MARNHPKHGDVVMNESGRLYGRTLNRRVARGQNSKPDATGAVSDLLCHKYHNLRLEGVTRIERGNDNSRGERSRAGTPQASPIRTMKQQ